MKIYHWIGIFLIGLVAACDPVGDNSGLDDVLIPPDQGVLEFRFILPKYNIPPEKIHRISLSFAHSVEDLYKGEFFKKINVSDYQEVYTLYFPEADYYYDAVITCSCAGDTCLNGDFPGGRYGMKHNFNKFSVVNQKSTVVETHFQ